MNEGGTSTASAIEPPRIKVCGVTTIDDTLAVVDAGVDLIGLNFYPPSPRSIEVEAARELVAAVTERRGSGAVRWVGVFVDAPVATMLDTADRVGLDLLQCHGDESPEQIAPIASRAIKAFRIDHQLDPAILADWLDLGLWGLLVDSRHPTLFGGTGHGWDFASLRDVESTGHRMLIAGGLGPDNVAAAVAVARPWGVDLASGVESSPGIKDPALVRRLVAALRPGGDAQDAPITCRHSASPDTSASAAIPHEEIRHGESRSTARR